MKKKRPCILFVLDPWETLDHPRDTSLRLAEESFKLGIEVHIAFCKDLILLSDAKDIRCYAEARVLLGFDRSHSDLSRNKDAFQFSKPQLMDVRTYSTVFYRVDPPVNEHYLAHYEMLNLGEAVLQPPPRVMTYGYEKIARPKILRPHFATTVTTSSGRLLKLLPKKPFRKLDQILTKPLNGAQSLGVERLHADSLKNTESAMLYQEYLKVPKQRELRLWLANGKLISHAYKVTGHGEWKINMDGKSFLEPSTLTPQQKKIATKIGRQLKRDNIFWAAIDLIGEKIIDYNITSPGLVVDMERVLNQNIAEKIIRASLL